jgi:hypothetical protein
MTRFVALSALACAALLLARAASPAGEKEAVAALQKLGADIGRADDRPGKPVVRVDLTMKAVKDADLAHLKEFKELETLGLAFTGVTDKGLAHLKGLTNLKTLVLWETKVTDKGLAQLKDLKKLQTVNAKDTKVTAKGAADLKKAVPGVDVIR